MQSPPSLYIPQFQLRELFVCFGRLNRILAEIGHGDFSVHSIMDKPLLLLTLLVFIKGQSKRQLQPKTGKYISFSPLLFQSYVTS